MTTDSSLVQTDFRLCGKCNKIHSGLTTCPNCSEQLTLVDHTFFVGKSFGRYTIKKILGVGGMGVVYEGVHTTLDKQVAIKIFIPSVKDTTFEKRFLREARILAGLKHPNIIEVYDFDISEWGPPFYAMEFLHGKTLRDEMKRFPGGIPGKLFATYLDPIISGLSHAHHKGIVHRDLKPDNIFIEEVHGRQIIKILDFGIAKSVELDKGTTHLTATQTVLGTPFYLSPEQILNKNIGPHTDQYALALITAEMLSGSVVRSGKSIGEILYKDVHNPMEVEKLRLEKVPPQVKLPLVKATMPAPEKRFPDIESFGEAVKNALEGLAPDQTLHGQTLHGVELPKTAPFRMGESSPPSRTYERPFLSIEEEVELEALEKERKRKNKRLRNILWVFILLMGVAAGLYFLGPLKEIIHGKPPVDATKKPVKKKVKKKILTLNQAVTVPPECTGILTYQGDTLVIRDPGGIYLLNLKKAGAPDRIVLSEKILGGLPNGNIAFIDNFTITTRNLIDGTDNTVLRNPPSGDLFAISPSLEYLAVKKKSTLWLYRLAGKRLHQIKALTVSRESNGFPLAISDRYLVFADSGKLWVLAVESGQEILVRPFDTVATGPIVIDDKQYLMAVGDGVDKVFLFNLKKTDREPELISEPGKNLALAILPGVPVLAIAKEGELVFRKMGKKVPGRYKEEGLKVVDIEVSPHGLMVLDKKENKIKIFSYKGLKI